jgi:hypothetical protein
VFRNLSLTLLAACAAACTSNSSGLDDAGTTADGGVITGEDGGTTTPDTGVIVSEFPESGKANVRFKKVERLRNDFARALELAPDRLCNELGLYSCTDNAWVPGNRSVDLRVGVHTIALGGVEPYVIGIRDSFDRTTITTPNAVERLAFMGCEQRVTQDLAGATGVIFRDLGINADGAIPDLEAGGVRGSIERLYYRALLREPRDTEVEHLKQLYRDVEATNEPGPARDWAILACFSVLTTMEALFY